MTESGESDRSALALSTASDNSGGLATVAHDTRPAKAVGQSDRGAGFFSEHLRSKRDERSEFRALRQSHEELEAQSDEIDLWRTLQVARRGSGGLT